MCGRCNVIRKVI